MNRHQLRNGVQRLFGIVLLVVAGCGPSATGTAAPSVVLGVENGTTLEVTIVVNGQSVAVVPARSGLPGIAGLPTLPWEVEARTPSGRVLTSMLVNVGDVGVNRGMFGRIDLSCGRLLIWAGVTRPSGPAPGPGTLGDCAP
jgi:hypothetical protein